MGRHAQFPRRCEKIAECELGASGEAPTNFFRYSSGDPEFPKDAVGIGFDLEVAIPGVPPGRRFDLGSKDRAIVGDAEHYTWTISGNDPSAKLMHLRGDAADLQALPQDIQTFLIMARDVHPSKGPLADVSVRRNVSHLGDVTVLELDDDGTLRVVRQARLRIPGIASG